VAVSPDGRDVYVAGTDGDAVSSFRVETAGALRQTGCLQGVPAPDEELDVAAVSGCDAGTAISFPSQVAVSQDGRTVFVGGDGTVTSYQRDPDTGTLKQRGCAEEEQSFKACLEVRGITAVNGIATTTDGRNVYVTGRNPHGVAVLGAALTIASRSLRAGPRGRVRLLIACPSVRARVCAGALRLGRAQPRRYRLRPGRQARIGLRLDRHARHALAQRATIRLTVRASDRNHILQTVRQRLRIRRHSIR
jgi:DNA-binding beta-propeller fold protein YncE